MLMKRNIGIIVNPKAKRMSRDRTLAAQIEQIVRDRAFVKETENEERLFNILNEYKESEIKILGIAGGDGTIMRVLTAMRKVYEPSYYPYIALLKGGNVNRITKHLEINGNPVTILEKLLRLYNQAVINGKQFPFRYQKTLLIDDNYVCTMFGTGLAGRFFEEYYKGGGVGIAKAGTLLWKFAGGGLLGTPFAKRVLSGIGASITIDGNQLPYDKYTIIGASTIRDVGLGIKAFYRADAVPDTFHFLATKLDINSLAKQLPSVVLRNLPMKGKDNNDFVCREVDIKLDEPFPWVIEGDVYYDPEINIKIGPLLKVIDIKAGDAAPRAEEEVADL